MATRSTIALEYTDGTVKQIYCHWDGYLENNGSILREHYTDTAKLSSLLDRGSVISLGNTVDTSDFYDVGSSISEPLTYSNITQYFTNCRTEEYDYILTRDQNWLVRSHSTKEWVSLIHLMDQEDE
jgi:hypothetical protein